MTSQALTSASLASRTPFHFIMIKPSHYDDQGYVIQWMKSDIPANSLAAVNGLALAASDRDILGPDVEIVLETYDETNTRIVPKRIAAQIRRKGAKALIGLIGVQSNQFPRASDLARAFKKEGLPVAIGGFHVSGCLAMLAEIPPEIKALQDEGVAMFAGEAEDGALDEVLRDAYAGTLKPLYNHMKHLPGLEGQPVPLLNAETVKRTRGEHTSFDLGRGCPFQCSFCTIINVQGRKSRVRTADDLEKIIRINLKQGLRKFFITDDNFARNSRWEELFDRLIHLRETEGLKFKLIIQIDTLCHRIPNFIVKARRAGVARAFLGLENINPDNLIIAQKRQNKITEYRDMLQQWRDVGVTTYAGYIIGFPGDTKQSVLRDVEIIKRELPLDLLEFFNLTPLPGSEDHKRLFLKNVWMDGDLNKYDLHHRVTHHPKMSDQEWDETYRAAWDSFYSPEHVETIIRRAAVLKGSRPRSKMMVMMWFRLMQQVENMHPLEGGIFRYKRRKDRRSGMKIESALTFYPRYWAEVLSKLTRYGLAYLHYNKIYKKVMADPNRLSYTDLAITPSAETDLDTLSLFTQTAGGEAAVQRKHVADDIKAQVSKIAAE